MVPYNPNLCVISGFFFNKLSLQWNGTVGFFRRILRSSRNTWIWTSILKLSWAFYVPVVVYKIEFQDQISSYALVISPVWPVSGIFRLFLHHSRKTDMERRISATYQPNFSSIQCVENSGERFLCIFWSENSFSTFSVNKDVVTYTETRISLFFSQFSLYFLPKTQKFPPPRLPDLLLSPARCPSFPAPSPPDDIDNRFDYPPGWPAWLLPTQPAGCWLPFPRLFSNS